MHSVRCMRVDSCSCFGSLAGIGFQRCMCFSLTGMHHCNGRARLFARYFIGVAPFATVEKKSRGLVDTMKNRDYVSPSRRGLQKRVRKIEATTCSTNPDLHLDGRNGGRGISFPGEMLHVVASRSMQATRFVDRESGFCLPVGGIDCAGSVPGRVAPAVGRGGFPVALLGTGL